MQGVAFRWHARRAARDLGLRGWISNRADGSVAGEAFGEAEALEAFLAWLRGGSPAAEVESVDSHSIPGAALPRDFESRR